jgi:hypothetical protein
VRRLTPACWPAARIEAARGALLATPYS